MMSHIVSVLGFATVAMGAALLIWHMLAERADVIFAALRMAEPVPALPASMRRVRIRSVGTPGLPLATAQRRAA